MSVQSQKQLKSFFQSSLLLGLILISMIIPSLSNLVIYSAQSNNLDTNTTSYIGSNGDEVGEATAISPDNTYWYGGNIIDTSVNYGKTPVNIQGGGTGILLHFDTDGKTLLKVLRYPSSVKDISIDKTSGKVGVVGAFGISYLDPANYTEVWNRVLPVDSAANSENFDRGTRVDIGSNGKIATLYGKRITVWDALGNNLTGSGNTTFGINAKIIADIAMVGANNTVVVIGETQKDGGPCSQWRGGWMKAYDYAGNMVWKNYDWTQYEVSGTVSGLPTNNCADTIPMRITLGGDNNLYMISKSAGGNSMYRYDPKNLTIDLSTNGKYVGGDNFNNTSNMSSQNITFMMKYAPTTGDIIKQQVWVSRTAGTGANSLVGADIAVDSSGVIAMVGQTASYFPDRLNQTQVVNGTTLPAYGNGYEGFYLELAPDMRTRIRATSFKKTRETNISSVSIKGNKRVLAGSTNYSDASIPTKNPIQPNIGGGNTDGFVSAWGFETATSDYAITATKSPAGQIIPLNSSFGTTINYSYTGSSSPITTRLQMTISEGLDYTDELYDGFVCTIVTGNKKQCFKDISPSSWLGGGSINLNLSISRVLNGQKGKEVLFQIIPVTGTGEADLYPGNNIATIPITVDDTLPATADYAFTPSLVTSGSVPVGGYAQIKVDYLYTGPASPVTDKKLKIIVPVGLEYDPLNRAGLNCPITNGLETCITTLTASDLKLGSNRTFFFRVKSPYVAPTTKGVFFGIYNQDGSPVDTIPANNQDKTINITVNPAIVATNDYQIVLTAPSSTVPLGQAITAKINLKYSGNTPPIDQRVIVTIPTGFGYNYLVNDGFSCSTASGVQTCQRTITNQEWQSATTSNGININLNLIADSVISSPITKAITAKLNIISKTGEVDITLPNNTATLNLDLSNVVVTQAPVLAAKVLLSGSYNTTTGLNNTTLKSKNLIPIIQPYSVTPFNYAGTESATTLPSNAVDWVLIELKQGSSIIKTKAALLLANGNIVDAATLADISLDGLPDGSYQLTIRHRNHLAINTATNISLSAGQTTNIDMTTNQNVKGGNQTLLATGRYGLKLGNSNGNSSINAQDRSIIRNTQDKNNVYTLSDINMDGISNSLDRILSRLTSDSSEI